MDAPVLTLTEHALVLQVLGAAVGAHLVGLVYFLANGPRVAPRYRMGTLLSVGVMIASGYVSVRLQTSWDAAYVRDGALMVPTGNPFDAGLRYANWLVTVPVLLVQVLFALDLFRENVLRLRTLLVASGLAMVVSGWIGQTRSGTDDSWLLGWGLVGTAPFLLLLVLLFGRLQAARGYLPPEAGRTLGHLRWVFLFFWGLYPIAYLLPAVADGGEVVVWQQSLFALADVGSKVLYGVLLAKVLRLRSAADGWGPAREPAEGALGHRPEDERYLDEEPGQQVGTRVPAPPPGRGSTTGGRP